MKDFLARLFERYMTWAGLMLWDSDPPNTKGMNAAALQNAETAKAALAWYTGEARRTQGTRDALTTRQIGIADAQIKSMNDSNTRSTDAYNYTRDTFRPVERGIVRDAQNYDTTGRREQEAARATADVRSAAGGQQQALSRSLSRQGINPSAGRSMLMRNYAAMEGAKAEAGAATGARRNVEQQGYARRMDAANLGRGLASNQATQASLGIGAGQAATGATTAAGSSLMSGANLMGAGFQTAIQGTQSAGQLYGAEAGIQSGSSNNGAVWGAVGSIAGAALIAY